MAGRINDHELIPLARNNRTPALQAKQCFKWPFSLKPIGACTYGKILHKFNNFLASREHKLKIKFNNDLKAFNANYITAIQANKFIWERGSKLWLINIGLEIVTEVCAWKCCLAGKTTYIYEKICNKARNVFRDPRKCYCAHWQR